MALVGGGGAGNIAGRNPSGTSSNVNYIGNHIYGYSGSVDVNGDETTMLEFGTGQQYIICKIQFNYIQHDSDNILYKIYINDEIVQAVETDRANVSHLLPGDVFHILIAGESRVKLTAQNTSGSSNRPQIVSLTGRVYA